MAKLKKTEGRLGKIIGRNELLAAEKEQLEKRNAQLEGDADEKKSAAPITGTGMVAKATAIAGTKASNTKIDPHA